MNITITGSLGNIGKPLTEILIQSGHRVSVVSSKSENKSAIEKLGAIALIGSVSDSEFLVKSFEGADAVFTMVPPDFSASHYRNHIGEITRNYAKAIQKSGVTRVVNLSSIGAHLSLGTGPITGLHDGENILNALEGISVTHLRAGFFYTNFLSNIEMIRQNGILGNNYPASAVLLVVHPRDIADAAAEELQKKSAGKTVRYVISAEYTLSEITSALGSAIGKKDLPWVEFSDEDALQGMVKAGLPLEISRNYTEMGTAVRNGILWDDYYQHPPHSLGKTKLNVFAKEFADKFN